MLQIPTSENRPSGFVPVSAELPELPMRRDQEWLRPEFRFQRVQQLKELAEKIAAEHNVTLQELRGAHRQRRIVAARRAFCIAAWQQQIYSSVEIGYAINREHSTVMHHCGMPDKAPPKWVQQLGKGST